MDVGKDFVANVRPCAKNLVANVNDFAASLARNVPVDADLCRFIDACFASNQGLKPSANVADAGLFCQMLLKRHAKFH